MDNPEEAHNYHKVSAASQGNPVLSVQHLQGINNNFINSILNV